MSKVHTQVQYNFFREISLALSVLRVMLLVLSITMSQIAANLISQVLNELDTSKPVDETTRYQIDRGRLRIKTEHFK